MAKGVAVFGILTLALHGGLGMAQTGWTLAWGDEFDGPTGAVPDAAKWRFEVGPGEKVGGNQEAETYCSPADDPGPAPCKAGQPNAYLDGKGHLVLVAVRSDQTVTLAGKDEPVYTSARMISVPAFRYGRIEASLRLPEAGKGVWPAFWALGQETGGVHWPAVGEIDVMEQWNPVAGAPDKIDPLVVRASTHGPKEPGSNVGYVDQVGEFRFPGPPSGGLHQFAAEWDPGQVRFYIDGKLCSTQSVGTLNGKEVWEQDRQPFNLLLNLAMGGGFFGYPDASTSPTPTMVVDYVRVYQRDEAALPRSWGSDDVGGPALAGSARIDKGVWTVAGSGFGIAGRFDQFQYAYRGLSGDGEVTAHVIDQTSKVAQAKAGVMLRDGHGAAAKFAMAFVSPDGSVHFRFRNAEGDVPSEVPYKGAATWMKVGRSGNVFTGYVSVDGKSWTAVGNTKIAMPRDLTAGLIATARDNKAPNIARFDYVDVTKSDAAYDGLAAELPGAVQAEEFDGGGMGYSYSAEFGEAGPTVERMPDVSGTETSAGGEYLTGLKAGRYINYAVRVAAEGDYRFVVRERSKGAGGSLHLNLDQKPTSKPFALPDTHGAWLMAEGPIVHLPAGEHTIALVTDTGGGNGDLADIDLFAVRAR
ncbi:Carbohydrate binding module (family 6) [Bryocella elongata]|uniref:Carbohydrate binding module (Family 6) n=1 Tax=Bryocella elongata TaxID=863522 RepID=A0A1H5UDT8_9BACT|nr:family 16 glycosylhydrolase [Bryocella elongata]SEF73180.1 Carbohydrate binding module (family 6) [Bryocella elongata]